MAYLLGGTSGESNGFERNIAGYALMALHDSQGLVDTTRVVQPTQGNVFEIPIFAPITYQDYDPSNNPTGAATQQNPALGQNSITATPTYAASGFDVFYGWTTAFPLQQALGSELGASFAEKVDQRVTGAYLTFKPTPGNTNYAASVDGFTRVQQLGAMELRTSSATGGTSTAGFTTTSVLELVRFIKQNWKAGRLPGAPRIVLDSNGVSNGTGTGGSGSSMNRLLAELTGGAVGSAGTGGSNLSALGNELLETGMIDNIYGCRVVFTTFLRTASRPIAGGAAENVLVGAYYGDDAVYTVMKDGLQIKTGEQPGGLQMWITGLGYFGSGVGDLRRGGAINIEQTQ